MSITSDISGEIYSYGLNQNGSEYYGKILRLAETWTIEDSSAVLIAQDSEGHNIVIADVSDGLIQLMRSRTD